MPLEIERRTVFGSELRFAQERAQTIVGHAAIFDALSEDLGGFRERIRPGAFAESLKNDDVRALLNHEPSVVLGRNRSGTLHLTEDEQGLRVEIDPPDTQAARDLLVSISRGDISQMSFGFAVKRDGQVWSTDGEGRVLRTLTALRLYDVSVVTFPAYPDTRIAVRAMTEWRGNIAPRVPISILRHRLALTNID